MRPRNATGGLEAWLVQPVATMVNNSTAPRKRTERFMQWIYNPQLAASPIQSVTRIPHRWFACDSSVTITVDGPGARADAAAAAPALRYQPTGRTSRSPGR